MALGLVVACGGGSDQSTLSTTAVEATGTPTTTVVASTSVEPATTTPPTTTAPPTSTAPTTTLPTTTAPTTSTTSTASTTVAPTTSTTSTSTTTLAPAVEVATFSRDAGGTTLETVVSCGPDGLSAEHRIDGEPVEPETAGLTFPWAFEIYHRVVAAVAVDGVDYLFDGGWWIEDRESDSCAPHEPPVWEDFADGGQIVVTEILWEKADFRDIACPGFLPDAEEGWGDAATCTLDFDHVRRATVDGRLLEIGFDCGPFGVGEVWWVVDGTMVSNRYYHPPESTEDRYEEEILEPMRGRYGDTVYDYVAQVQWLDSEVYVFDIGRVRIDLNLETALKRDNCALVDWSGPEAAFEG